MIERLLLRRRCKNYSIDSNEIFILLSAGELNTNKNHEIVLKAVAHMGRKDIHYFIAGQGELEFVLKQTAEVLGISEQIHLLGYREDMDRLMRAADIYILPSLREGLSVSLMEAMACGLPVICSNIRGNNDLMKNEKGGYLITGNNEDLYAIAIKTLINDERLMRDMGSYNRKVVSGFDSRTVIEMMRNLYGRITV